MRGKCTRARCKCLPVATFMNAFMSSAGMAVYYHNMYQRHGIWFISMVFHRGFFMMYSRAAVNIITVLFLDWELLQSCPCKPAGNITWFRMQHCRDELGHFGVIIWNLLHCYLVPFWPIWNCNSFIERCFFFPWMPLLSEARYTAIRGENLCWDLRRGAPKF